jgi:pimeloyl-ACP methyl ester carboxylesterase
MSTYVLIPGAFHGGWAWRPVASRLRAAGHRAVTLTMPGLSDGEELRGLHLRDAIDKIVHEVETRDLRDLTLVAHSWGGYPMTGAAARLTGRLSKAVYFSAFVPQRGNSALDELPAEIAEYVRGLMESSSDYSWAPSLELVQGSLLPDASEQIQHLLWEMLVPQPGFYGEDVLDVPPVPEQGIPVAYLLAENDRGLGSPDAGERFAARLGVSPLSVPGTHEALITHPDELARAILTA